ncbi:hypothetical protein P692DRAFT_20877354 [Suillus brevipes Sb2]|nr:hypothetical protein P692DRAFT_20877354 [Suillus brevipes Sb2]
MSDPDNTGQTCQGRTADGSQCLCLRPKLRKDQKEDEPALCINCGHFDTSHPDNTNATLSNGQSKQGSSNVSSLMSKYTHLFSNAIAPEEVARRETNDGFQKQDNSSLAAGSSTKKGATTKNGIRNGKEIAKAWNTASDLCKTGVGSIVMVTVGTNKKGCLNWKVAPHNGKIEELRKLEMTMKDIDTYLRNLFPQLFAHIDAIGNNIRVKDDKNDSDDGEPSSGSFQWFLIVKSGKNMVKSSQEVLTGGDVLKTRHPAGRKWTDQFIYFGTVQEVSDELDETMEDDSEIDTGNLKGNKRNMPSTQSRTKENKSNVKLTFEPKKRARSNSPLFGEIADSDIEFVGPQLSLSPETMPELVEEVEPKRKRHRVVTIGATDSFATLSIDDNSKVGTEAIAKVETELLKESPSHSTMEENDVGMTEVAAAGILSYDFDGPYDFGNFDDNIQIVEPSPASSILTDSLAMNVASSTANSRKELGSGHPQGSRTHVKTQASSSRPAFNMLLKPKNNPWLRK